MVFTCNGSDLILFVGVHKEWHLVQGLIGEHLVENDRGFLEAFAVSTINHKNDGIDPVQVVFPELPVACTSSHVPPKTCDKGERSKTWEEMAHLHNHFAIVVHKLLYVETVGRQDEANVVLVVEFEAIENGGFSCRIQPQEDGLGRSASGTLKRISHFCLFFFLMKWKSSFFCSSG
jgi:hypothetical protein